MASYRVFIDHRKSKDEFGTLSIQLYQAGKSSTISLGMRLLDEQFKDGKIVKHEKAKAWNSILANRINAINIAVNEVSPLNKTKSPSDIRDRYLELIGQDKKKTVNEFKNLVDKHCSNLSPNTVRNYKQMYNILTSYDKEISDKKLADIDVEYIEGFRKFLLKSGRKTNSCAIMFGFFITILKEASERRLIPYVPFYKRISMEETDKRSLTLEQIKVIKNAPIRKTKRYRIEEYRDMFLLSFYLCGINPIDLFHAKMSDVVDGRLMYRRSKTKRKFSVHIPDAAWEIINKYKSKKGYLVWVLDNWNSYERYTHQLNEVLQNLDFWIADESCKGIIPKDITFYSARHSFATLAMRHLKADNYIIGHALGHSWTHNNVTETYIDFDLERVDEIQDKLINLLSK